MTTEKETDPKSKTEIPDISEVDFDTVVTILLGGKPEGEIKLKDHKENKK